MSYQEKDIYGVWKGQQNGKEFVFTFERDRTCVLYFTEKGKENADVLSGTFEIDFTKQPMPLTIRNLPQLSHAIHTAVDFIRADSIRVAYFAPNRRLRPIAFGTSGNMHLKRISEGFN
jgi:hypothetical protein